MTKMPPPDAPLPATNPARALERGETVGRFVLLGLLGRGGMGEVYAAYDPELDRKVAVKILRARSEDGEARLLREAQAIAKLQHPNVVVVYDVGKFHDTVFIAMEFVDGNTLGYWMHAEKRTWRETLRLFQQAGQGLAAAHEIGMIHRDFKPDNVMLTKDGQVRVMDFGLARQVSEGPQTAKRLTPADLQAAKAEAMAAATAAIAGDPDMQATRPLGPTAAEADVGTSTSRLNLKLTQTGAQIGTPAYMAPEQFAPGRAIDARTDQFSFCVALYEALYGERPFVADNLVALTAAVLMGEVRPPPEKTRVPGWIRRVLLRGLSVNPAARYGSMTALLTALERDPAVRRRRWLAVAGAAAAVVGLVVGANRLGSGARTMCSGGGARFAGVWEAGGEPSARKDAIRQAFTKTGKAFAAQAFVGASKYLDEYVERWTSMYRDACEATHVRGDQSAEVMDLRMSCLSDRLGSVRALTDVLAKADERVVQNAVTAAGALPSLDPCADVVGLRAVVKPPADPETRKRVDDLRRQVAEVKALSDSGQCTAAEARGVPLIEAVRATRYQPLLAEVLTVVGYLGDLCDDPSVAIEHLKRGYEAAVAGHADAVAAEAASGLPVLAANRMGQTALANDWARIARASLERMGGNERLEGYLLSAEAAVAGTEHDFDRWIALLRRSQEVTVRALGADHPMAITGIANIGDAFAVSGHYEEAIAADRQARAAAERTLGPDHPLVGNISSNECEALNRLGRYGEALVACQHALAIWRATGTDAAIQSYGLTGVGLALLGEGRAAEAVAPLQEAVTARESGHIAPALVGESRFALARALWSRPAERPRALALARQARSAAGIDAKAIAAIDAWLAKPGVELAGKDP
jgi:tetratricopeptide (TPR) repeat protein/predicted Ser/Thr protein kinase